LFPVPADKTGQVFRQLAAAVLVNPPQHVAAPTLAGLDAVLAYMAAHRNGLTAAAVQVVPEIAGVLAALDALPGCRIARLSGAGPTCFAIFESSEAAEAAQAVLAAAHPGWWVTRSRLG
jgi:4-diphosphocytidyl-2-C-methyl-D-erythritol kinase